MYIFIIYSLFSKMRRGLLFQQPIKRQRRALKRAPDVAERIELYGFGLSSTYVYNGLSVISGVTKISLHLSASLTRTLELEKFLCSTSTVARAVNLVRPIHTYIQIYTAPKS